MKEAEGRKRLRSAVDNQRAAFLKHCRARLDPEQLGLPSTPRKRTAGLRREDVAALSGVSVSWYTWLEQGRDIRVSDEVLERLCVTFRLSADERVYLFSLVQHRAPRIQGGELEAAPPDVVRMINNMGMPAVILNLRWDVLAWNQLTAAIYVDYAIYPPAERNVLHLLLARPVAHTPLELERTARRLIARLRFDYSKNEGDPQFEALIRRLDASSALFRRLWRNPEFNMRAYGRYHFKSARYGELTFEHLSVVPDGHPNIRIVVSVPESASAHEAIKLAAAAVADAV
ncbi:MAG TPA: helix-turn-helix transcriptional regulator [Steroidobacteraceae bacterium]|jgi:transcriptional regulator with XRE-family HTH domain